MEIIHFKRLLGHKNLFEKKIYEKKNFDSIIIFEDHKAKIQNPKLRLLEEYNVILLQPITWRKPIINPSVFKLKP